MFQFQSFSHQQKDYKLALDTLQRLIFVDVPKQQIPSDIRQVTNIEAMQDYLQRLQLQQSVQELKIIHVAGTKGKGSTCAMIESMLRANGLKTGLYTSPHLVDVRERIRCNGQLISKDQFTYHFWKIYDQLAKTSNPLFPSVATYFRILTCIALQFFIEEKVDVAILEVGLGGRLDATNVVTPVVCGINSIGWDHMELLGNTLPQIASEKAGIMKQNIPCIVVPQSEQEIIQVFQQKAQQVKVESLQICSPLESYGENLQVGILGEHQKWNASLAIALCHAFLQRTFPEKVQQLITSSSSSSIYQQLSTYTTFSLPESFKTGLQFSKWEGRSHIIMLHEKSSLLFYLDGAHTDESISLCKKWFSNECKQLDERHFNDENNGDGWREYTKQRQIPIEKQVVEEYDFSDEDVQHLSKLKTLVLQQQQQTIQQHTTKSIKNVLIFMYTGPRDPKQLLHPLMQDANTFDTVIFCPLDSKKLSLDHKQKVDSAELQKLNQLKFIWEDATKNTNQAIVIESINDTIEWLVNYSQENQVRVLITGSLYLVGDFIRKLSKLRLLIEKS